MINNNPGGRLWVDPDGVEGLGQAYQGHVELYDTYLAQLTALRSRYANAWGDDDMGEQFSTKFLEGMDNLEAIIGGVKGTLAYTAQGLTQSALAYREADEAAAEVGHKMAKNFETLGQPLYAAAATEGTTTPLQPARLAKQHAVRARVADPEIEPGKPLAMRAMTVHERAASETVPARAYATSPAQPAMPAISSMFMKPEYTTAYVGGQALPAGYQLISLNTFEDGSTRVDANLYDSVTPLAGTTVTTPEGTVIDPGRGQFFVVKENPNVDPTAPGYEPLVLSYAPDGTPTPLIPGF
ncbi:WXG100 family type VII secretion target [Actinoplanes sp. CA-252034]|uniref:WXG100 family type VII secretion target n=1 Tax=Actinoplanes sp. CA-252034 TaxID=3239906 RepID=UPI003D956AEF